MILTYCSAIALWQQAGRENDKQRLQVLCGTDRDVAELTA